MAGIQTKDTTQQDSERAQDKKRRLEPAPLPVKVLADESVPFTGLLGVSAMEPPMESHAALLGDPRFSRSVNNARKARTVTELQTTYGNQYVQRLVESLNVQAKLTVGSPDDQHEKEADRVADVVTGASTASIQRQTAELEGEEPIQAKSEDYTRLQCQAEEEEEEEEEEPIQTKKAGRQTPLISSSLQSRINSLKGGGQPLPESARKYFEPRFGSSFNNVRIHNNSQAANIAKSINSKAFTTGKDIVFGTGQYSPETSEGKYLLAHELTHVVQQGASKKEKLCSLERLFINSGEKNRTETIIAGTWAPGDPDSDYDEFYKVWYSKLQYRGFKIKQSGKGDDTKFTIKRTLKDGTEVNVKTDVPCAQIISVAKSILSTKELGVELTAAQMAKHAKAYLEFVRNNYKCPSYRNYAYYKRLGKLSSLKFIHKNDEERNWVLAGYMKAARNVSPFISFATLCLGVTLIIMSAAATVGTAIGGAALLSFDVLMGGGMTIARIGLFVKANMNWGSSAPPKDWIINHLSTNVDIMRAYASQASFPLPEIAFKALGLIIKNINW